MFHEFCYQCPHLLYLEPGSWNPELDESSVKTSDVILLILAAALIVGMLLTAIFGRGSRHGYGMAPTNTNTIKLVSM